MKWHIYRLILVAAASAAFSICTEVALADNDLHDQDNMADADFCAACHRAHTAQADKLLTGGAMLDDFCFTCHDGSGAETDVVNGELDGSTYGTLGAGLRGGGFVNAKMDTDRDGVVETGNVTSSHSSDGGTPGTMWGSGPINSSEADYGITVSLSCCDCHNPHGNGNYRILRGRPDGMENEGTASEVNIPDEPGTPDYETTYTGFNYRNLTYVASTMDEWCAQCHTRYMVLGNSGHTDSGDVVFAFRHAVVSAGKCLACHVAHGTPATMGTYSGAVEYPESSQGLESSALLAVNDRIICLQCHDDDLNLND